MNSVDMGDFDESLVARRPFWDAVSKTVADRVGHGVEWVVVDRCSAPVLESIMDELHDE